MLPIPLTNATRTFVAPSDWNEQQQGECLDLQIADLEEADGSKVMISAWVPSPEELQAIVQGKPIFLKIFGTAHPVVALYTDAPEVGN